MTREARTMAGIILLTVPTIQYGGYFLLTSLVNRNSHYMDNALRQNFFRAGHAHAGVFVILSLVCQILADSATLPEALMWVARIGVPLAAILLAHGIFSVDDTFDGGGAEWIYRSRLCGRGVFGCWSANSGRWSVAVINPVKYLFLPERLLDD